MLVDNIVKFVGGRGALLLQLALGHGRPHRTGTDAVGPDALPGEAQGDVPGEGNHGPLGGGIYGAAAAQLAGNRGHGNDVAPLLGGHDLAGLPGDGHGAFDVDLADKVIVGIGEFLNGLQAMLQHARAVDQHVDLPEGVHRRLHQLLVVLGVGNVTPDEKGMGAGILDFLEYFVLIGFAHVCQHQLGALFGKDLGGLHADTGVAAGNDAYFIV